MTWYPLVRHDVELPQLEERHEWWSLSVDGSSNKKGSQSG